MTHVAKAFAQMRENGGEPYGIICSPEDAAYMRQYGVPVRVSQYAPKGYAVVVGRDEWGRSVAPHLAFNWEDL